MRNPFTALFRARDKSQDSVSAAPIFYFGTSQAGKPINDTKAIQPSTMYACVRVSNGVNQKTSTFRHSFFILFVASLLAMAMMNRNLLTKYPNPSSDLNQYSPSWEPPNCMISIIL